MEPRAATSRAQKKNQEQQETQISMRMTTGHTARVNPELRVMKPTFRKKIQKEHGITVLHVTHSSKEAEQLADCVLRMENGVIEVCEK